LFHAKEFGVDLKNSKVFEKGQLRTEALRSENLAAIQILGFQLPSKLDRARDGMISQ
jgi:hypothetical protein